MSAPEPQPEFDLAQELRELGEQIKRAFQVARDHPKTKEMEQEIVQAIHNLETEIQRAVKSAQENESLKKAGEQVKQAAQSVKDTSAPDDIARGIAKGVHALNDQIRKAIEDAEKSSRS